MPPLAELMERVEAAGITLAYSPGRGKVSAKPSAKVTPELAEALKEHKSEIVAALTATPAPPPQDPPAPEEPAALSAFAKRQLEQASERGLVAMWSRHHGYVSIHDPTTGKWHDLRTEDAPDWAVPEACRRKRARKGGGA
jgi:hypothetical protein